MRLLLDTCTFIWLTSQPRRIPKSVRAELQNDSNSLYLSDVNILEICFKWSSGRLPLPTPPRRWCEDQADIWGLEWIGLKRSLVYRAAELPTIHVDPFDRLLVSTALEEDCTLVTPDPAIAKYPVAVLW